MLKRFLPLLLVFFVAACAGPMAGGDGVRGGVSSGMSRDDVIARLGPPTRAVPLAAGHRFQYSQQPMGQQAWMVDFDALGRVTQVRQVLTAAEFERIVPGQWTRMDVEREFGPPARVDGVASWDGPILTYRWRDVQNADMFYWVYLDFQGIVRRAHPGMEVRDRLFNFGR